MSIIQTLGTGQGYAKGAFLGFSGSGKTWTAILLALGIRDYFKLDGHIVFFDTEGGSEYVARMVKEHTGKELLGVRARAFDDLMATAKEAMNIKASVFVVDSITHPWRELCDSYLKGVNEVLKAREKNSRTRLTLQDWNPIKARWSPWPDWYLNSPMHVIVCGRAGDEWGEKENEDTGKMEAAKVGIKMKTEGEFGFEGSLVCLMERVFVLEGKKKILHRATVIKERFGVMDGAQADNPGFEFFLPHIERLKPGAHAPVDVETRTEFGITEDGDSEWQREKRDRAILCEEVQGELMRAWPGQTAGEKKAKVEAIETAFNTRSWTKVESLPSDVLRTGLDVIRTLVGSVPVAVKEE